MGKSEKKGSTKDILLNHSKAKVELLQTYLSTYLNIISRVKYFNTIHIYDLLCGEGIYSDESEGSPIAIIKSIKNHFFANNRTCPNIELWLNDNGKSDIENDKMKIERVEEQTQNIFKPSNLNIKFTSKDYNEIYPLVEQKVKKLIKDKHLIFIDPHGYKNIRINDIIKILKLGNVEIILFLPLFDMYRFANKSYDLDFKGGNALRLFLNDCFNNEEMNFKSVIDFTEKLKNGFINLTNIFVDTFLLEKDKSNYYGLFFFTPSALGFEKMLEAKWKIDSDQGRGFNIKNDEQINLFDNFEVSNFPNELIDFLKKEPRKSGDVYLFGLKKGYLPKHCIQILKPLRKSGKIIIKDFEGNIMPKNGFYLNYENYKNPKEVLKYYFK